VQLPLPPLAQRIAIESSTKTTAAIPGDDHETAVITGLKGIQTGGHKLVHHDKQAMLDRLDTKWLKIKL
jgi:hypothetical protein